MVIFIPYDCCWIFFPWILGSFGIFPHCETPGFNGFVAQCIFLKDYRNAEIGKNPNRGGHRQLNSVFIFENVWIRCSHPWFVIAKEENWSCVLWLSDLDACTAGLAGRAPLLVVLSRWERHMGFPRSNSCHTVYAGPRCPLGFTASFSLSLRNAAQMISKSKLTSFVLHGMTRYWASEADGNACGND